MIYKFIFIFILFFIKFVSLFDQYIYVTFALFINLLQSLSSIVFTHVFYDLLELLFVRQFVVHELFPIQFEFWDFVFLLAEYLLLEVRRSWRSQAHGRRWAWIRVFVCFTERKGLCWAGMASEYAIQQMWHLLVRPLLQLVQQFVFSVEIESPVRPASPDIRFKFLTFIRV